MTQTKARRPKKVHNVIPELVRFLVPIDDLEPHPDNSRVGDVEFQRASLRKRGQYRLAIVQQSTGFLCVGNHMWKAAKAEGWTHLAAVIRDLTDDEARDLRVADNRGSDLATYDEEKLLGELNELVAAAEAREDGPDKDPGGAALSALAAVGFDQLALDGLSRAVHGRPTGAPAEAPDEFGDPEAGMTTDYACPNCAYEWSGQPKPGAEAA